MGVDSSTRRPTVLTIRSMTSISCLELSKVTFDSIGWPLRST